MASAAKKNGTPRFFESVLLVDELMGGPNAGGVGRIGKNAAACRVVVNDRASVRRPRRRNIVAVAAHSAAGGAAVC